MLDVQTSATSSAARTGTAPDARATLLAVAPMPRIPELTSTCSRLDALIDYDDNWDTFGSCRPRHPAILHALTLLPRLFDATSGTGGWDNPLVGADSEGNVTLEWWCDERYLTLTITDESVDFLRTWGEDTGRDMDDGALDFARFKELWGWLRG